MNPIRRLLAALARDWYEIPCPLCAGTPRAPLTYTAAELVEHTHTHAFEDVYDWTRAVIEDDADSVAVLDQLYDVVQHMSTTYTCSKVYDRPSRDLSTAHEQWTWMCTRCDMTPRTTFLSREDAERDRLTTHRCPL